MRRVEEFPNDIVTKEEVQQLRHRLKEAEETLRAIGQGEVDGLIVKGSQEEHLRTLVGADKHYHLLIEEMNEGALTLASDSTIIYCNRSFAEMLKTKSCRLVGNSFFNLVHASDQSIIKDQMNRNNWKNARGEINLVREDGAILPVHFSIRPIWVEGVKSFALVIADLSDTKKRVRQLKVANSQLRQETAKRRRTEEELLNSKQEKADILDSISDGFFRLDSQLHFTYVNDAMLFAIDQTREELIGRKVEEAFPHCPLFSSGIYHQVLQNRTPLTREIFFTPMNIWLDLHFYPDNEGLTVLIQDITQRKNMEDRLRQSEERFRKSFHASPIMASVINADDGVFSDVNEAWLKTMGYKRHEIIGQKSFSFDQNETNVNRRMKVLESLKSKNQGVSVEGLLYTKNGEKRTALFSSELIQLHGKSCVLNQIVDITDRKQAEESLRQSEELFSAAFHCSPVMMAIQSWENDCVYVDVNSSWLNVLGYSREEVIGRNPIELQLVVDMLSISELASILKTSNILNESELQMRTKQGQIITVLCTAKLININKQQCFLSIARDITERKQLEQELSRLERLNLIGEMAASIGHEIRNPMTAIRGFLQMLSSKKEYADDLIYFDLMIEELDRANDIIREYLGMAKDKRVDLQPRYMDSIVRSLFPMIESDANYQDKNVILDLNQPPQPLIDESEIRQLILNLARNGLEAMPAGGTLTIGTDTDQKEVVLYIKDQGTGIPPEILDKLGTPFVTTKDNGTGLGLAVCYSIAKRHNARIDYEITSSGTTFYVRFPISVQQNSLF